MCTARSNTPAILNSPAPETDRLPLFGLRLPLEDDAEAVTPGRAGKPMTAASLRAPMIPTTLPRL